MTVLPTVRGQLQRAAERQATSGAGGHGWRGALHLPSVIRLAPGVATAVCSVIVALGVAAGAVALLHSGSATHPAGRHPGAAAAPALAHGPCRPALIRGVLPRWARAGFSSPRPRMPYEVGRAGRIAAVIFGQPLLSPPSRIRNNKILWVSHAPARAAGTALRITAQRMRGATAVGAAVHRSVAGGPGPSIINLPAAGCWRLTLSWAGNHDSLDIRYRANHA